MTRPSTSVAARRGATPLTSRLLLGGAVVALAGGLAWSYSGSRHAPAEPPPAQSVATDQKDPPAHTPAALATAESSKSSTTEPPATAKGDDIKADAAPSGESRTAQATAAPTIEAGETKPLTEAPKPAAPLPSFLDARALTPAGQPVAQPPAAAPAAAPVAPAASLFQDNRPLATAAGSGAPAAGPAPAEPVFRDVRPLASAAPASSAPAAAEPLVTFRDTRPLAVSPMFQDKRPIAAQPTFQDTRPLAVAKEDPAGPASGQTTLSPEAPRSSLVAIAPPTLKIDAGACGVADVKAEPLDGGQMALHVTDACHPNETIQIRYAGAEFLRKLNAWGSLDFTLDAFAGTASTVDVRFGDGNIKSLPVTARDLDKVSKIAVVWRAPVNLDLHVFEYAARLDQPGHLSAKKPATLASARLASQTEKRGHGFLGTIDDEKSLGDKVEVYTFVHNDEQTSGAITLALDYETRGDVPAGATCGQGALAEIDFQVVILPRGGQASRQSGMLTRVPCGTRIATEARFNQAALPGLRIRR